MANVHLRHMSLYSSIHMNAMHMQIALIIAREIERITVLDGYSGYT